MKGALVLLQRPLLEPFHKHIWSEKPEPPVDIHHHDKQVGQGIFIRFGNTIGKFQSLTVLIKLSVWYVFRNLLTLLLVLFLHAMVMHCLRDILYMIFFIFLPLKPSK